MRQITSTISENETGIKVYRAGRENVEQGEHCQMPGCTRTEQDAHEAMQPWHVMHGYEADTERVPFPVIQWSAACDEHHGAIIDAVADAMTEHGTPWTIETVTWNYQHRGTPKASRETAMTGDQHTAAPTLF